MGRHFSKNEGATVILGPLKQKSQGAQAPPPGSDAYVVDLLKHVPPPMCYYAKFLH